MSLRPDPQALEPLKAMWMTGGSAKPQAPEAWQRKLEGVSDNEAELRLLALAGQVEQVAYMPKAPSTLHFRKSLPELALPPLEESHRAAFRRILANNDLRKEDKHRFINFLASRGRAVHPLDWLPSASESGETLPELYAPWIDWVGRARWSERDADLLPDEANWHDFYPAERTKALRVLRRQDPAKVPALYLKMFPEEKAEVRFRHLQVLSDQLGDHDVELLESLVKDRSERIRDLARSYLARMGKITPDPGALSGLQERFQKKRTRLDPVSPTTPAARKKWAELMLSVPFADFAALFEMEPEAIIEGWKFGKDREADYHLSRMIAFSASDEHFAAYLQVTIEVSKFDATHIDPMLERMSLAQRQGLIDAALTKSKVTFDQILDWAGPCLGTCEEEYIRNSQAWVELRSAVGKDNTQNYHGLLQNWLLALGLLATHPAANALLTELTGFGMHRFDPRLQTLLLNAALSPL